jgi:ketosteroid isomerase-like protein
VDGPAQLDGAQRALGVVPIAEPASFHWPGHGWRWTRSRRRVDQDPEGRVVDENVETLRRYHERLNGEGELALELVHPEVEVRMFEGSPIPGPYLGHEGLRRWREDVFDVIEDWRLELDDVIAGDDPDVVVALQRFVGRMEHTDLPANFPLAVVVRFRDGLIAGFEGYRERDEALHAAEAR